MKKLISILLLCFALTSVSHAATWVKLQDNKTSKLMLDKQSIVEKDLLKKAWIKIEFKAPRKSAQMPDKEYNSAKLLWFFNCTAQKSATTQVLQYLNGELVYSAGIEANNAAFTEPVPETDVDVAMRYVCAPPKAVTKAKPAAKVPAKTEGESTEDLEKVPAKTPEKPAIKPAAANVKASTAKDAASKMAKANNTDWSYSGKEGPDHWGKLSPAFSSCDGGYNQSPVNIEQAVVASLKPLKSVQIYAAQDIVNNGNTLLVNFKPGNTLQLDNTPYRLKKLSFHAPSEHKIQNKAYPLEAQFLYMDKKGNQTIIAVMYAKGKSNAALANLWEKMPNEVGAPIALIKPVLPRELMPKNQRYFRFSGSLTTPPCSEGVSWIIMKTPMTASAPQIVKLERALRYPNNRPLQALNGRLIVE